MKVAVIIKKKEYIVHYIDMPISSLRTAFTVGEIKDMDAYHSEEGLKVALAAFFNGTTEL